jgi:hypothetical protein
MPPIILKGKPDRERLEALLSVLQMEWAMVRHPKQKVEIRIEYGGLQGFIAAIESALEDMREQGH